ncbi:MAG: PKD domain-containing protein [Thermoplasmata archaeon]|nr:PKD domain-containing protein [Thermoplasmata archaeon]
MRAIKSFITVLFIVLCIIQVLYPIEQAQGGSSRFPGFITIPDRFFEEDSGGGGGLVNLSYHFQDNGTKTIIYDFEIESDPAHINGQINGKMVDFVQVVANWSGKAYFQIMGIDIGPDGFYGTPDDVTAYSNIFNVTVTPTNDPPIITSIDSVSPNGDNLVKLTLYEDIGYNISVEIDEPDSEYVLIAANLTLANLEIVQAGNGGPHIHFTPSNWDIGQVLFAVTATDDNRTTDTVDVEITVENTNDLPRAVIDAPEEGLVVTEGVPVVFDGSRSSDDDMPHGDLLKFKWESNISAVLSSFASFETALEVGHHRVKLTTSDNDGFKAIASVNLTVIPKTTLEITSWDPEPYLLMLTTETRQSFEVTAQVGTTNLEPIYEWYVDDEKVNENGPGLSSEFELNLRYIDRYETHEVRVIAYYSGAYTSNSWTIVFQDPAENKPPNITPVECVIPSLAVDDKVKLEIVAYDPEGDTLSYKWTVDGKLQQGETGNTFTFKAKDLGKYEVKVTVSDGTLESSYSWNVAVNEPLYPQGNIEDLTRESSKASEQESELMSWLALAAVLIVIITIFIAVGIAILLRKRTAIPPPEGGMPQ